MSDRVQGRKQRLAGLRTVCVAMAVVLGGGCYGSVTATARTPTFVAIDGDVWVIEDHSEPVFYTEGFYWRYSGGLWYRSHDYNDGWVTFRVIPESLRRVDRPTRYVHYVAPPHARRHVGPPARATARAPRNAPPPREIAPVPAPSPDRGPRPGASAGPPAEHRRADVKRGEDEPDRGADKEGIGGKGRGHDKDKGGRKK